MTRFILSIAAILALWLRAVTIPFVLILRNNEDYIVNNALAEDQAWNALLAGEADESISARCHRCKWVRREKFINWLFGDDQHCHKAYLAEELKSQLPEEYRRGG
jgi:hypothetical protein